ncbi:Efflux pump [Venturia inaequalis]|nr:Efflux pump [Venturia inaequalis]
MNPSRSHGRLLRLASSSLSRATPPINHCSSTSRTHLLASRAVASKHRQWKTCILRSNSRLNPESTSHYPRQAGCRLYSSSIEQAPGTPEMPDHLDEKEKAIFRKLTDGLQPTALEVQDVSGGCGSMYSVSITSERFKGLAVIKQHRLVNEILGEDIKSWHGIQLRTKAP